MARKKRIRCTNKIFDELMDLVRDGLTLTDALKKLPGEKPHYRTILKWINEKDKHDEYMAAREDQIMLLVDQMMDISRMPPPDYDNPKLINAEMQRRNMEISNIKFLAAKLMGSVFKDTVNVEGGVEINIVDYSKKKED